MTTYFGEFSSDTRYYLRPSTMSASAAAKASDEVISITPIPSSELLEGLDDQILTFSSIAQLRSVDTLSKQLYQGKTTNQYLVFQPVTEDDLAKIRNDA